MGLFSRLSGKKAEPEAESPVPEMKDRADAEEEVSKAPIPDDVSEVDVPLKNMKRKDKVPENRRDEDLPPEDWDDEDLPPEDWDDEDLPPEDWDDDDLPAEGPPPMTKEEEKELRRRMKRIVREFRIRSFGMDGIALIGLGISMLLALVFGWMIPACITGPAVTAVGMIFEMASWFSASGEAKRMHPDPYVNGPWREKVWHTGVRTMRFLVILAAAEAALPFICVTAYRTVTWQRWLRFGIAFAVLALLILLAVHEPVREIGYRRDILEDTEEDREMRKHRRRHAILWRLLALIVIGLTVFGQVTLNRRDWMSMTNWSMETANLVFCGIYAVESLFVYIIFRKSWKKKKEKIQTKRG